MLNSRKPSRASLEERLQLFEGVRGLAESTTVEFKGTADRGPILCSICAMANTYGGQIFVGVADESGFATEIKGFETPGGDPKTWFSNVISTSIYPIPEVEIEIIDLGDGKFSGVLTVPKSNRAPHIVMSKSVSSSERERIFWRFNDKSMPAPFFAIEQMFERRQRVDVGSSVIGANPSLGLDDGTFLAILAVSSFEPSARVLGREDMALLREFIVREFCPTFFVSPDAPDFEDMQSNAHRIFLKLGKLHPEIKESGNNSPSNSGFLWWVSASVSQFGNFEFRTSRPPQGVLLGLDFIGASLVFACVLSARLNVNLRLRQHLFASCKINGGLEYQATSRDIIDSSTAFSELAAKKFRLHNVNEIFNCTSDLDVTNEDDLVDMLSQFLSRIGNAGAGGDLVSITEWSGLARAIVRTMADRLDSFVV